MRFLTQKEQDIFFTFLKEKLRLKKCDYARIVGKSRITIYWQIKHNKVSRKQVKEFKEIYFAEINEI